LLKNTAIFVVPSVNYDGWHEISNQFKTSGSLSYQRKNKNVYKEQSMKCGQSEQLGVDLLRNYDYRWGSDDQGSSSQICSDNYRGPKAFSEAETQAIS
jgi:carboxypeptidase T